MIELTGPHAALCGTSVIGTSHVQLGQIKQDACLGDMFGDWSFIAVADGHGSAPHFRSDRGARLAVETARQVIRAWAEDSAATPLSQLPEQISAQWRAYVDTDLRLDPAPPMAPDLRFMPYGSTLAAVAMSKAQALVIQIGDGDILIDDGGGVLRRPLAADEGLVGEQTYSLCLPDPVPHFRVTLLDLAATPVSRPFTSASTDGLHKSYSSEENFLKAVRSWQNIVAVHGIKPAVDGLERWLAGVTAQGNGDDISLMLCTASNRV